jgi:hypothetical protein
VLDVHFVFIGAACVHGEIDDGEVFVFDVLIGDFFDGVGVLIEDFVHEVRFGDDLFELSNGSELFFLFFSSDGVSLNLLVFLLLFVLHVLFFGLNSKRIKMIMNGYEWWSYKIGMTNAIRYKCFGFLCKFLILLLF